jgi:hypothetical protein
MRSFIGKMMPKAGGKGDEKVCLSSRSANCVHIKIYFPAFDPDKKLDWGSTQHCQSWCVHNLQADEGRQPCRLLPISSYISLSL